MLACKRSLWSLIRRWRLLAAIRRVYLLVVYLLVVRLRVVRLRVMRLRVVRLRALAPIAPIAPIASGPLCRLMNRVAPGASWGSCANRPG